jgi:hypothetical protein
MVAEGVDRVRARRVADQGARVHGAAEEAAQEEDLLVRGLVEREGRVYLVVRVVVGVAPAARVPELVLVEAVEARLHPMAHVAMVPRVL